MKRWPILFAMWRQLLSFLQLEGYRYKDNRYKYKSLLENFNCGSSPWSSKHWPVLKKILIFLEVAIILFLFIMYITSDNGFFCKHQQQPQTCLNTKPCLPPKYPVFSSRELYNRTDFRFRKNNKEICIKDVHPIYEKVILVMVHSARENSEYRKIIRETWGSQRFPLEGWTLRLIFLLGTSDPKRSMITEEFQKEDDTINKEQSEYRDLIEGNFFDSYKNLTYKHLMGYKWVLNYCQNAKFILKADDDYFLDLRRLLKMRVADIKQLQPVPNMYCITPANDPPKRNKRSKWYLSMEEFPEPSYPDYCYGATYGITLDLLYKIYSIHQKGRFVFIDDLFVTGVLHKKALEEYNGTLKIVKKSLGGEYICEDRQCYQKYCNEMKWDGKRNFGAITLIRRDSDYGRFMKCLWRIVNLERTGKNSLISLI